MNAHVKPQSCCDVAIAEFMAQPTVVTALSMMDERSAGYAREMMKAAFYFGGGHGVEHVERELDAMRKP